MSRKVELVRLAPEAGAPEAAQQPDTRAADDVFRTELKKPKLGREAIAATLGMRSRGRRAFAVTSQLCCGACRTTCAQSRA